MYKLAFSIPATILCPIYANWGHKNAILCPQDPKGLICAGKRQEICAHKMLVLEQKMLIKMLVCVHKILICCHKFTI